MNVEQGSHRTNMGYILFLSISAALGGFLFGFDSGVINGTVGALQKAFNSDSVGSGISVASMLLGCAAGAFFAGTLADKLGRKIIMIVAATFFLISAVGSGIATSSFEFVIYRIIGGLAVGAASVIAPAYICEIAPARMRGALASLQQMGIVVGLFIAFLSNYLLSNAAGGASEVLCWNYQAWSWMFWVEAIPATLFIITSCLIPESPRYLVAIGEKVKAKAIIQKILPDIDADAEVEEIWNSVTHERKPRFSDLLNPKTKRIYTIVFIGIGLAILQQAVGINVIMYYGAVLWEAAGFSEKHSLLINIFGGVVNVVSTIVAMLLVDRIGRKRMLQAGSIGMFLSLLSVTIIFCMSKVGADGKLVLEGSAGIIALIAANLFILSFALTWGPVTWVLLGEMFSNKIRGMAMAISSMALWIAAFVITITFPILLEHVGLGGSYAIYTIAALISFFFVYYLIKETKGKTLEEMHDE